MEKKLFNKVKNQSPTLGSNYENSQNKLLLSLGQEFLLGPSKKHLRIEIFELKLLVSDQSDLEDPKATSEKKFITGKLIQVWILMRFIVSVGVEVSARYEIRVEWHSLRVRRDESSEWN